MASSSAGGVSKGQRLSGKPNNRFSCQNMDIEWTLTDSDGINYVVSQLLFNAASWSEMNQSISKLQRELSNYSNISPVYPLLQQALRTKDVTPLLRAYTIKCDFYKVLNKKLAEHVTASNMGNPISSMSFQYN
ncbi:unnamed protein product [Rotaria socialis]